LSRLLSVENITKRYPGVTALDSVSFVLDSSEVLALIGENGAGKSTLMKILGGVAKPDGGQILIDGAPAKIQSVNTAAELGIAFIHQELNVLDNIDVAGNVFLGREPGRFGLMDRAKMRQDAKELLEQLGLPISVDTPLTKLSLAQQQMVEIAKALSMKAKILIMDEPTSSLTLTETERLLRLVQRLSSQGVAIIYISHRLTEVLQIADRVVALKDGKNAGELVKADISKDAMVRMMVGRDLERRDFDASAPVGEVRLEVKGLKTRRYPTCPVDLQIRGGEIFCLAGLVGAGRSELVQAIFGADIATGGSIEVDGVPLTMGNPIKAIEAGIGLVPEDRRNVGLLTSWSICDNITLADLKEFSRAGLVQTGLEAEAAQKQSLSLAVKSPSVEVIAANLSGGNQQKVVLGKWLILNPKILILDEPTRGVDVGAKAEIYQIARRLTQQGIAVLMVSSDMEEVISVSDRIGVMHEGRLTGILTRAEVTEEKIMRLAIGTVSA
jgi:ribose transport system ATP-binding protein